MKIFHGSFMSKAISKPIDHCNALSGAVSLVVEGYDAAAAFSFDVTVYPFVVATEFVE